MASGLRNFRPYDTRHTAITRLAEDPNTSPAMIRSMAGHVSQRMTDHYTHIGDRHIVAAQERVWRRLRGEVANAPDEPQAVAAPHYVVPRTPVEACHEPAAPALKLPEPAQQSASGISGTYSMSSFFFLPQVSRTA